MKGKRSQKRNFLKKFTKKKEQLKQWMREKRGC
jgi:hypothetical protein